MYEWTYFYKPNGFDAAVRQSLTLRYFSPTIIPSVESFRLIKVIICCPFNLSSLVKYKWKCSDFLKFLKPLKLATSILIFSGEDDPVEIVVLSNSFLLEHGFFYKIRGKLQALPLFYGSINPFSGTGTTLLCYTPLFHKQQKKFTKKTKYCWGIKKSWPYWKMVVVKRF